jgi:hypothetical protein
VDSEFWISGLTDDDVPAVVGARVERVFFLYRKQL